MAIYYWVGGTGTWSGTGNTQFAITSGGVATALNPTNVDTVNFDANSGTAATVTVDASAVSLSTTINKSDINLSLSGSPTLCTAAGTLTLTAGTLTLNTYTLTVGLFGSNNSNVRTIAFGTGNITLTGNANNVWLSQTLTNLTISGSRTVNSTYSGATGTRACYHGTTAGGSVANAIDFNVSAGTDTGDIRGWYRNLIFTGFSGILLNQSRFVSGNLTISNGMTVNAGSSGTEFNGTSGTQQITTSAKTFDFPLTFNGVGGTWQLQDALTSGAARTITFTNGTLDLNNLTLTVGFFTSANSNTRVIAFGTGNITIIGSGATVWSNSIATNFTYTGTPTVNLTYSGATGTRAIQSGQTSSSGTETNSLNFNVSAGTDIILFTATARVKNVNFTGFAGTLSGSAALLCYGNLTYSAGMTIAAATNPTIFSATSGTQLITTNAQTLDLPLSFNGIGGTFAFQDALTQGSTKAFTITNGTVQLKASATSTVGAFATSGTNQKSLQSTVAGTQATLSQASGTVSTNYLTIRDINATGGATWNSLWSNNNVDAGDNTGWVFGDPPITLATEYTYALRSFTQPRRF
jgi:hypothetical protein